METDYLIVPVIRWQLPRIRKYYRMLRQEAKRRQQNWAKRKKAEKNIVNQ